MQKIMYMLGGGLVGIATSPIFSIDSLIGMAGCVILIMATYVDR